MDMTKFESIEDPGFTAIAGELRRWVKELGVPSNLEVPRETASQQQQLAQVAQMAQSLSLSDPNGIRRNQPITQAQNYQLLENQESQSQSIVGVRHGSPQSSPLLQTPIKEQQSQTGTPQPSTSLGGPSLADSIPTASPSPGAVPTGINIVGAGGNVQIGNSEQHFSGNFYGGVHIPQ